MDPSSSGAQALTVVAQDPGHLLNLRGNEVPLANLQNTYVALYFSGNWCPPCRKFTPVLAQLYHNLQQKFAQQQHKGLQNGEKRIPGFEVVFVSSDRSAAEFREYRAEMPWLTLPYESSQTRRELFLFSLFHLLFKISISCYNTCPDPRIHL